MGGTGGAMLTTLLVKAKHLDRTNIVLSENGHAHSNHQDFENCPLGVNDSDIEKIKHITTSNVIGPMTPPYFLSIHLKDLTLAKQYFNKIIRITYTKDDILDLAYIFVMKNRVDINSMDEKLLYKVIERKVFLGRNISHFKQLASDDNVLYVTWEEIYNGNVTELINRLADFTSLPNVNFNENTINHWRELTKSSLAKIKDRIDHGI
jgi:hypothetical protein